MTGRSHLSQHLAPGAREPAIKGRRRRPIAGHQLPVLLCVRAFVGAALVFVTAGGAIASNVMPAGAATPGDISTVAGNGSGGCAGDGSLATSADLNFPLGVAVDSSDNLVIADADNNRVGIVAEDSGTFYGVAMTAGDMYTVAGQAAVCTGGYSGDGGLASSAQLNFPSGVAVDGSGNLVIADAANNRVRVVAENSGTFYGVAMTAGDIYTVAGNGTGDYSGDGGPATSAELFDPAGVAVDGSGNLVIADALNWRVRVVADSTGTFYGIAMTAGDIYTVAGNGTGGQSGDGGPATSAELNYPQGVAVDSSGNLVIADADNNRVRVVADSTGTFYGVAMTAGDIYTVAGIGTGGSSGDGGPATSAELNYPSGVAVDGSGNLVIADTDNNRVLVVAENSGTFYGVAMTAGDIYAVAGNGTGGYSGDGGPATSAQLAGPAGVAVDGSGNLVIADAFNKRIRVVAGRGAMQCSAGSFGDNGDAPCTLASPGNFVANPGSTSQTECTMGTYSSVAGAVSCTEACPGNFVANPGSTSQTECTMGTYSSVAGAVSCTEASPGNFVANPGSTSQTECTMGTYSSVAGAVSCTEASPGNFVANPGSTSQTECTMGTYSSVAGAVSCTEASPGNFVANPGSTSQTECTMGTYSSVAGAVSCTEATPGNFVANPGSTSQTECTMGTYSSVAGAVSCTEASPGNFVANPGSTSQTECTMGTYSSVAGAVSCTEASPGNFVANPGSTSQTECTMGTYSTGGASSCTTCPSGTTSPAGASACTSIAAFVIADTEDAAGSNVTFWSAKWAKANVPSKGPAPSSFKGFANETSSSRPACGGSWTSDPGNSSGPPPGPLPQYLAVLVSSSVTKSGANISGNIVHIVVVKTNPGYSNDPGHTGTGTVVSFIC